MNIHPLMLAAAMAFWGWQTGLWVVALPVAALLCASFYVSLRWTLSNTQQYRVADFCTVLALLLGGYLYFSYGNPRAIVLFFQWLPVMFLPLALAHAYGTAARMDLRVLFWSLRRNPPPRPATFAPWFPYYAVWIIAASAANMRDEWFYIGLILLVSWPLVRVRPWSYRVGTWGVAFSIAVALGYGLQWGLHAAQGWLENVVPEWISTSGSRTDPYRSTTDIGHIGTLKDSNTIVLRITTPDGAKPPRLLHRASYNTYFSTTWVARGVNFTRVESTGNNRWPLAAAQAVARRVTVHDYSAQPNPVLSLPAGTRVIEGLTAISVQRNALGAVQIVRDPGFFTYTAAYADVSAPDGAATPDDLRIPAAERNAFEALADELGFRNRPPAEFAQQVKQYFANGYRYSIFRKDSAATGSPIVDFLLRTKSGHCEYFATATVLLLRAAGIPARYATGFAVAEHSELENAYVVRERHAHSWARAQVNGAWIDIDTTPPTWVAIEAERARAWSKLYDLWSWLRFRVARTWADSDERQLLTGALIVVFPFALWLAWRLYRSRRTSKNTQQKQMVTNFTRAGADSEFYCIEQRLQEWGWGRRAHETAGDWLARLKADAPLDCEALAEIIDLHNRYRFDPRGLSNTQRAQLRHSAAAWLAQQAAPSH